MVVSQLFRYPVKSLGGQSVTELQPLPRGFEHDRRWMFADADGRFISQRSNIQLAAFSAEVAGEGLLFKSLETGATVGEVPQAFVGKPERARVTVWDDTFLATEIHYEGAYELTRRLGIPDARLFYMAAGDVRPVDPRYADAGDTVSFADGYPYLITTTASLRFLAHELGADELDVRRFRPNMVVATQEPWAEDRWTHLTVGSHTFSLPKPCARCVMITHQPGTRERDLRVLATLSKHRKVDNKVLFGVNALHTGGKGMLRVGESVAVGQSL